VKIIIKQSTETARGITILLACGFDVDLSNIDSPELEKKATEV